jgi:chloramphenicol 3-O-phosphotransferase
MRPRAVILITGVMAAGKSTVAQALAERLPRSVHVRGDAFRRMVVNGRVDMAPGEEEEEARRQLHLRYRLAAHTAEEYFKAGFTAVVQDIILGADLPEVVGMIHCRPLLVVVLAPRPGAIAAREQGRAKTGYGEWTVEQLDAGLREDTPRLGLWLDTSDQSPAETVDEILMRAWHEGEV